MRTALGDHHPDTLIATANLAQMLWRGGNPAEAEPIYRDVVTRMGDVFGENHAHVATVSTQLALVLDVLGKSNEARAILSGTVERYQSLYGPDHAKTVRVQEHLDRVTRQLRTVDANSVEGAEAPRTDREPRSP
jgi:hypothetical protein